MFNVTLPGQAAQLTPCDGSSSQETDNEINYVSKCVITRMQIEE